ncbi:TetR family transcriptional regulator [Paramicrobacterium agarici]|uniref:TetR family transcriptional regulator n=1 Tax=Paramicrobacterium agarici TaxID=630514 RepID=A0A2A9DS33_9MICO|nr:TetR family transcriptional regulator [Microbacterium agarici]PFG29393.1 TetR family transcriptional regulator [Microbacterium agarici]
MAETAATARGRATRQRVLDAATEEFARYGLAGARVDRIAANARTNKAQLYVYFGSKEALFDDVVHESMQHMLSTVPISADDLADWAVRLYDEYLERPDLIRLATWARLERRPEGHLRDDADRLDATKLDVIGAAQRSGEITAAASAFDVMAMVIAMSMAWSPVSNVYAATAREGDGVHAGRREFLRTVVERAVAP